MPNKHYKKWKIYAPTGFVLISLAILSIYYAVAVRTAPTNWLAWCLISIFLFCGGIAFIGSGFIHKIKSDLIRKQKSKEKKSEEMEERNPF